jgi:hypothetical protein
VDKIINLLLKKLKLLKEKICFWLVKNFALFGVAKLLQEKNNYELSAIVDSNESLKNLFTEQKIVNFKKMWFYGEQNQNYSPDYDYLKLFENKYDINLSFVASTERFFYKEFNPFYHFTKNEMMSVIEQECKLFESVLDTSQPNCIFSTPITNHAQYLLYRLCKKKNINFFTLEPLRFYNRWIIVDGLIFDLDDTKFLTKNSNTQKSISEIKNFMKTFGPFHNTIRNNKNTMYGNRLERMKAMLEFPFSKESPPSRFSNYGRTKKNILLKGTGTLNNLRKNKRKKFIDEVLVKKLNFSKPFIYFPLHVEPEKVLLMGTPYHTDQISVIKNIVKSLPVEYQLFVKEHPGMKLQDWRESSFYEEIMDIPNVTLIHPEVPSKEIIENCSLVITIFGTSALESAFYEKPTIVFRPDLGYDLIPSIYLLKNYEELQSAIKNSLKKIVKLNDLSDFVNFMEKNTFEIPFDQYNQETAINFNYKVGYLKEYEIPQNDLKLFMEQNASFYEKITYEFLKILQKSRK